MCQPLLAGERFRRHEQAAGVRGSATGTWTETVSSTDSQCQVSDINSAKLCYTRDILLSVSLNNNQPDLSRDMIFRLKGLTISRGGRRKQKHIKICLGNRCDQPLDPFSVPGAHSDQTVMPIVEPAVPVPHARYSGSLVKIDTNLKRQSVAGNRNDKRSEMELFVRDESVDVLLLTETRLRGQGDEAKGVDLTPPGHTLRSFPRATRGGGVAFLLRNSIMDNAAITTTFPFTNTSFEHAQLSITTPQPVLYSVCTDPLLAKGMTPSSSLSLLTLWNTATCWGAGC